MIENFHYGWDVELRVKPCVCNNVFQLGLG